MEVDDETESNIKKRVDAEREAHTVNDVLAESYTLKNRFHHIYNYPSYRRLKAEVEDLASDMAGKNVLDYGCGRGEQSLRYLNFGANQVIGIDISAEYVKASYEACTQVGTDPRRYSFIEMDAHNLRFDENKFDLVIGHGILHHLDADRALCEVQRVLKPGGKLLLLEPLADNPMLKAFRKLTPNARTIDEKPFTKADIVKFTSGAGWKSDCIYCGILEAPVAVFTSLIIPKNSNNIILRVADILERYIHRHGWLNSWNQYVLINMTKTHWLRSDS